MKMRFLVSRGGQQNAGLSPKANRNVEFVDGSGRLLGSVADGDLRLFDAGPFGEFGRGLMAELVLNANDDDHHRAIALIRSGRARLDATCDGNVLREIQLAEGDSPGRAPIGFLASKEETQYLRRSPIFV